MAKYRLSVPQKEQNILFAKSGNRCAFPKCDSPVIAEVDDKRERIAEMAHMIAYSDDGPRSDPALAPEDRNKASNLILLCPTHHTLVDKFEHQYHVHVLREMKQQHEGKFDAPESRKKPSLVKEPLHASLLPLSHLPVVVFSANTQFNKTNVQQLFDLLPASDDENILYTFELRDKKLYTFHDLRTPNNPLFGTYDESTVKHIESAQLWDSPDDYRLYVALLNRAFSQHLRRLGVAYDSQHHRHFFMPGKTQPKRRFKYTSLAGRQTTKSVVNNPITKATGESKSYWVHLAANMSFQHIAAREWVLTIRPERHLTTNGSEPYFHSSIGRKITRIKSTMYNWLYLQEIQLWREFITQARKRLALRFGKQSIVIENNLPKEDIEWLGIPEDQRKFAFQEYPEDLFTSSEIAILGEAEEEFYDELFYDENED